MSEISRPVLRYHGGKFRLAPWVLDFLPQHDVYVEPYGGAASVLLQKDRAQCEVYNDLNDEIVNVFRVLRDPEQAERLAELVRLTPFARAELQAAYERSEDPVEQARRTVVRSFMGFGSGAAFSKHATGFRTGIRGGRHAGAATDLLTWPEAVPAFVDRLRGVTIESRDALHLIRRSDRDRALFYVDPPYPLGTRGSAKGVRQKYAVEMTDDHHRELAAVLREVKGMVVLSGYPCDLYDLELFPDWERHGKDTHADGGRDRTEVLWLNPACSRALKLEQGQTDMFQEAA